MLTVPLPVCHAVCLSVMLCVCQSVTRCVCLVSLYVLQVTAGNFGQLLSTGRLLAIAVAEEDPVRRIPARDQTFRDMLQTVAIDTADRYSW